LNKNPFDWNSYVGELITSVNTLKCGHCGNKSGGKVVASHDNIRPYSFPVFFGELEGKQDYEAGLIWELVLCPNCDGINLRLVDYHTGVEPEIGRRAAKLLYPPVIESPAGMPPAIDEAYQAALEVRHIDHNAFAVLLRKILEGVCEDKEAKGKDLYHKLNDLARREEIPSRLAEMAHGVRSLGNIGAHGTLDLTSTEALLINDLCRAILEYVYTAPGLIERARLSLEKIKSQDQS
jgi:hypothetical protein